MAEEEEDPKKIKIKLNLLPPLPCGLQLSRLMRCGTHNIYIYIFFSAPLPLSKPQTLNLKSLSFI